MDQNERKKLDTSKNMSSSTVQRDLRVTTMSKAKDISKHSDNINSISYI